jgi:thiol-disulfide isomerase/thioredoxin
MAITDHYTNARLVTFVEPPSLIKAAVLDASAFGGKGATPKTIGTTTTTTRTKSLQLKKFRTFEEMLESHSNQYSNGDDEDNNDATPVAAGVLVDFYSPWCGPCKVMKHELMSIRQRLESLVRPRRSSQSSTVGGVSGSRGLGTPLDNNANVDSLSEDDESKGGRNAGDPIEVMSVDAGTAVADATKPITASTTTNDAVGIPVYHIDTNKFPQVGARNNVRGLPTLVLFVDGKEVWRNEGIMSGEEVINSLTKILSQLQKDYGDE